MFIPSSQGAAASTALPTASHTPTPSNDFDTVRHMLFGSPQIVQATIQLLHKLRYADPNDWSKPMPTGRPNEVMAILTKRMKLER